MGKFLRRVFSLVGVIMMWSLITSPSASAWIDPPNQVDKPVTWWQSDPKYDQVPLGFPSGGDSLRASGCAQFSYTAVLRKAQVVPKDYDIMKMRADNQKMLNSGRQGAFNSIGWFVNAPIEMTKAVSDGKLEFVDFEQTSICHDRSWVEQKFGSGEYFGFLGVKGDPTPVNGHWVAFDYIKDNKIHVADSGFKGQWLGENPHYGSDNPCIFSAMRFKRTDGTKATDLPNLDESSGSESGSGGDDKEKVDLEDGGVLTDKYLEGMPPPTAGEKLRMDQAGYTVTLPQAYPLNQYQKQNIRDLKESLTAEKTLSYYSIFRASIAFVGILLYLYSVLFLIAYALDRSYTESGTFTRLISFNRMSVRSDSEMVEEDKDGKKYLTWPQAVLISFGIAVLASLMVSGVLVKWVSALIVFIADGV